MDRWRVVGVGLFLALGLSSCAYLLPDTTPTMFGLLADRGDTRPFEKPLPMGRRHALLASTSYGTAVAIRESDGSLWTWGSDHLGDGLWSKEVDKPTKLDGTSGFIGVAAGSRHVLALRSDGTVWGWGDNKSGQLGFKEDGFVQGDSYDKVQLIPKQNPVLKNIVSIAAGDFFSAALDIEGNVWVWGTAAKVQKPLQVIIKDDDIVSVRVEGWNGALAIIKKDGHASVWTAMNLFMKDKPSFEVGNDKNGVGDRIVDMAFDGSSFFVLTEYGDVYAYGSNTRGNLGLGDMHDRKKFSKIRSFGRIKLLKYDVAVDDQGRIWRWGVNVYNRKNGAGLPSSSEPYPIIVSRQPDVRGISMINHDDFFAISSSGIISYYSGGDMTMIAAVKTNAWILGE